MGYGRLTARLPVLDGHVRFAGLTGGLGGADAFGYPNIRGGSADVAMTRFPAARTASSNGLGSTPAAGELAAAVGVAACADVRRLHRLRLCPGGTDPPPPAYRALLDAYS